MKNLSIKVRMTLWYTAMISLMAALVVALMLAVNSAVVSQTARMELDQAVRGNLSHVTVEGTKLKLDGEFQFYVDGVHTLVYSGSEALMAGQLPVPFTGVSEPFQNGLTRPVDTPQGPYYVLDLWVQLGWESGVWLRGLLAAPQEQQGIRNLLYTAVIAMPVFVLLAALGGYWIAKRAFRPLDTIVATAQAIDEGKDLSERIGLQGGRNEFTRLADAFDHMLERLERSFEAEKRFTADASHELRTPVSVILGACEYAEKYDETPEERQETIAMIRRQGKKMSDLINRLLTMTRMEQGVERARLEETDLTALVRGICEEQERGPEELIPVLQEGVRARVDGALLTRLLQNLIDNGFNYGNPGGHVWVALRREGEEVLLSVRDDGPGIPAEEQEKIWQRFYQIDSARTEGSGAGLGLAMVRQIAAAHGGHMTLESTPGQGSEFTLHLPL